MEIRDCAVDDLDDALDVRTRSFGPLPASSVEKWACGPLDAAFAGTAFMLDYF